MSVWCLWVCSRDGSQSNPEVVSSIPPSADYLPRVWSWAREGVAERIPAFLRCFTHFNDVNEAIFQCWNGGIVMATVFYIQSFSLTECIVVVRVRYAELSVCLWVWASLYLCVCVSVRARTPKLMGQFQWNFLKIVPYITSCVRISFSSLT